MPDRVNGDHVSRSHDWYTLAPVCRFARILFILALASSCGGGGIQPEKDLGPIDNVLDDLTKTVWPGVIDSDGGRHIRLLNGFYNGKPSAYWFSGFAPRFTAQMFWFCYDRDTSCPLGPDGKINPVALVGNPVFSRIPGEQDYSPYWAVQVVRVPDDYRPNDIKSQLGIEKAVADGLATVAPLRVDFGGTTGVADAIRHCLLVLDGTALERNGADVIGSPGTPTRPVPFGDGWHKRYEVKLFDFSAVEGLFAPDPDSTADRTLMASAAIFVLFRDCDGGSTSPLCDAISAGMASVSELGVENDFTGDGDKADTNNLLAAIPGEPPPNPDDKIYSPLWAVNVVKVKPEHDAEVQLIDTSGDQNQTDLPSVVAMRAAIADGLLDPAEPMSEAQAGNSIPGNDGKVFFNCPSQVPVP